MKTEERLRLYQKLLREVINVRYSLLTIELNAFPDIDSNSLHQIWLQIAETESLLSDLCFITRLILDKEDDKRIEKRRSFWNKISQKGKQP